MRILDEVWEAIDDLKDDKQKLQAENAKLREALKKIADRTLIADYQVIAKQALSELESNNADD